MNARCRIRALASVLIVLAFAQAALAQGKVRYRDLFDQYFDEGKGRDIAVLIGADVPAAKVTALKYKVLLYEKGKDDKAAERLVDPKTYAFKLGDRIRLSVEPYTQSLVYIFHVGASGEQRFLYPRKGKEPKPVQAGEKVALPRDGYFEFTKPAGKEKLIVVAAEKPVNLDILGRVLAKHNDPNATYTAEEQEIRKLLNATIEENLKSFAEKQIEKHDQVVRFRGLGDAGEQKQLTTDVKAQNPRSVTLELPKEGEGTLAVCLELQEGRGPSNFLVTIPLKSSDGSSAGIK